MSCKKYLVGSLADQGADLRLLLEKTSLDLLIKIWNNTASPLKLSFVVVVSNVTIDSKRERRVARVTEVTIGSDQTPTGGQT